jgi:hypothetical protein
LNPDEEEPAKRFEPPITPKGEDERDCKIETKADADRDIFFLGLVVFDTPPKVLERGGVPG